MAFRWFGLSNDPKVFEFRCGDCGELHKGSPSFGYKNPPFYFTVPEAELDRRVRLTDDTCVVDDEVFFIRGLLEIPIQEVEEPFLWGVWVSQSRESFERYVETFDEDQSGDGSFGWLEVTMPGYIEEGENAERESLACDVTWRGAGERPLVTPQACDHPLYRDIAQGISWDRAIELARQVMHGEPS